jgi:hypothetical protein
MSRTMFHRLSCTQTCPVCNILDWIEMVGPRPGPFNPAQVANYRARLRECKNVLGSALLETRK